MPIDQYSGELLAESQLAVAEVLLSRVLEAIEGNPNSDPISESYTFLGDLAYDDCCGVLAASPLRAFSTINFPQPTTSVTNCNSSLLAVDIIVVLLRCHPVIDPANRIPTTEAQSLSFGGASGDGAIIHNVLLGDLPEGWESAGIEQSTSSVDGGCVAIDTRVTIGLPQSTWCIT